MGLDPSEERWTAAPSPEPRRAQSAEGPLLGLLGAPPAWHGPDTALPASAEISREAPPAEPLGIRHLLLTLTGFDVGS